MMSSVSELIIPLATGRSFVEDSLDNFILSC